MAGDDLNGLTLEQRRLVLGDALLQVASLAAEVEAGELGCESQDVNPRDPNIDPIIRALKVAAYGAGRLVTLQAAINWARQAFHLPG